MEFILIQQRSHKKKKTIVSYGYENEWSKALPPQTKAVKFSQPKAFNSELTVVIFNTVIYYSLLFSAHTTKEPPAMWFVTSLYNIPR